MPIILKLNGSIPAYAGDPYTTNRRKRASAVYPRLRGGSLKARIPILATSGLSPPTRGIRICPRWMAGRIRSIPAYAGDPLV